MLLHELTEARVQPNAKFIAGMERAIDKANRAYQEFLDQNNDEDDIEELADLLNATTSKLPVTFDVVYDERKDPNEWLSAEAGIDEDGKFMTIYLMNDNLEGKWGPKTFKDILMQAAAHEAIHWEQYGKIGLDRVNKIKSGHQIGQEKMAKSGDPQDWFRSYLADPHELMAYGSDLAREIKQLDDPESALRNPEKYREQLPSYQRYRSLFDQGSKEIKQLLKYTADYFSSQ